MAISRKKVSLLLFAVLAANIALDRVTKLLALAFLKDNPPVSLFHNVILLIYAENSGAFLSMGNNWPFLLKNVVFIILPLAVCVAVLFYLIINETRRYRIIAVGSIIAGGLSNIVDRILNNFCVIDFLNFGFGNIRTGILNVADLSVTFGALAWFILEFMREKGARDR